jgi:hypothetical protein
MIYHPEKKHAARPPHYMEHGWWISGKSTIRQGADRWIAKAFWQATPADIRLIAAAPDLLAALNELLERYCQLANSGDCGNWDPEEEAEVRAARAAIAKATEP